MVFGPRQPKRTLDVLRNLCLGLTVQDLAGTQVQGPLANSNQALAHNQKLLGEAMNSIQGVTDLSAIDSLANPLGTLGGSSSVRLTDYELINYFVVQ